MPDVSSQKTMLKVSEMAAEEEMAEDRMCLRDKKEKMNCKFEL